MNTKEKVALLRDRFIMREDTFAVQTFNPEKGTQFFRQIIGRCTHDPVCPRGSCPDIHALPLTNRVLLDHLQRKRTIGTYQLSQENQIKWVCLDIDVSKGGDVESFKEELKTLTLRVTDVIIKYFGKQRCLVETSGGRGYHVWLFFDEPIDAVYGFTLGHWIVQQIDMIQGLHIEVYPKQTTFALASCLVKIPLGIHQRTKNPCMFVDHTFAPKRDQWSALLSVKHISNLPEFLRTHDIKITRTEDITPNEIGRTGLPCMTRVMEEGLREGTRDIGMFRLGVFLKDRGFPHRIAEGVAFDVNEKSTPPLSDDLVETKIRSAYSGSYKPFPCNEQAIDSYCSSSCRFWQGKVDARWRGKGNPVGTISRD